MLSGSFVRAATVAGVLLLSLHSEAIELRIGSDGSGTSADCDFSTLAAAVAAVPADGERHLIRVETDQIDDLDYAFAVDGQRIHIRGEFEPGSGCSESAESGSVLEIAVTDSLLPSNRTIEVRNDGELILENIWVRDNLHGGILVDDAELVLRRSLVSHNSTQGTAAGAGIVIDRGLLRVEDSVIFFNQAATTGGGIFCSGGSGAGRGRIELGAFSRIRDNEATSGGGIYLFSNCDLVIGDRVQLIANEARINGGAIALEPHPAGVSDYSTITLNGDATISFNTAENDGGGVYWPNNNHLQVGVSGAQISLAVNEAGRDGGALAISGDNIAPLIFPAMRLERNRAGGLGGAISVRGERRVTFQGDCRSISPRGEPLEQGDRYCAEFIDNGFQTDFGNNRVVQFGGTLYAEDAVVVIDRYAIHGNDFSPGEITPVLDALAIQMVNADLTMRNVLVSDHAAAGDGQYRVISVDGGSRLFTLNSTIAGNRDTAVDIDRTSSAQFIGTLMGDNEIGIADDVDTDILQIDCSLIQYGSAETRPGFVETERGRFRLPADSPWIDGGLACADPPISEVFVPPNRDLDGARRMLDVHDPMAFDLGAFEFFNEDLEVVFIDNFE